MMKKVGGRAVIKNSKDLARWSPGVMMMMASALRRGIDGTEPKMKAVSWEEHIQFGHTPYRRDCRVCQESRQDENPHKKIRNVQCAVLSLDTAGPLVPSNDQGGHKAIYMLIGTITWRIPKGSTKLKPPCS